MFVIINILYVLLFHADSCDGYTNITDTWRNYLFSSTSMPGFPKDDALLTSKWLRFTGIGGDRIVASCLEINRAGSYYTVYLGFSYPTTESVTPATGTAYANAINCYYYSMIISVALCPGGFYIYNPASHPHANLVFATCKKLLLIVIICFTF